MIFGDKKTAPTKIYVSAVRTLQELSTNIV